jgi:hypothetical protein
MVVAVHWSVAPDMLQAYVSSVLGFSHACCKVFHVDVAKVDRDAAYVAMVVHICCKQLFQMFHLFFRRMLQMCLFGCCICFTHMLEVFYLAVAYAFK